MLELLKHPNFTGSLLIGHSKGNLVLSEALYALESDEGAATAIAERCRIVTMSAVIGMPRRYKAITDVIGQYDLFGAINSRPGIMPEHIVPHAWHSTNTEFPLSMGIDVSATLRTILALPPKATANSLAPMTAIFDLPQQVSAALSAKAV